MKDVRVTREKDTIIIETIEEVPIKTEQYKTQLYIGKVCGIDIYTYALDHNTLVNEIKQVIDSIITVEGAVSYRERELQRKIVKQLNHALYLLKENDNTYRIEPAGGCYCDEYLSKQGSTVYYSSKLNCREVAKKCLQEILEHA